MFEHLDDPNPFSPDEPFRAAVRTRGRRRRRRRQLAAGGAAVVVIALGTVGLLGAWAQGRIDDVERLDVTDEVLDDVAPDQATTETVLVIGSDQELSAAAGLADAGARADLVMLVRLDRSTGTIRVLSLPRDLWVTPPGSEGAGGPRRLAELLGDGGASLLTRTVQEVVDTPVHHVVQVESSGLVDLVDQLGGLRVRVEAALRDPTTGLAVPGPGCATLGGTDTLALVRSRSLQSTTDGRWRPDVTGDLGRIERQQLLLAIAQQALTGLGPTDLVALADLAADHAGIDQTLDTATLLDWARWAAGVDAEAVAVATLPTRAATTPAGASVLVTDDAGTDRARAWIEGSTTEPPPEPDDTAPEPLIGPCD